MGGAIAKRKLTLTRQLIPAAPLPGFSEGMHYVAEGDASVRFVQSGSEESTTWTQITAKAGPRVLRTVSPEEGR